jgi:riboflavin synthase
MFTGIILELGKVISVEKIAQGAKLKIFSEKLIKDSQIGDSIAVNGVCLTVTEIDRTKKALSFDVSYETLKKTTLGELKKDSPVNLESALTLNTKLGGHLVSGHVDGVGVIKKVEKTGDYIKIEIEAPQEVLRYCVPKGSIAVDGISLTVVDLFTNSFSVVIIPHTLKMTTLGFKNVGDSVNLEPDIIAKYVERLIGNRKTDRDEELLKKLKDYGYL